MNTHLEDLSLAAEQLSPALAASGLLSRTARALGSDVLKIYKTHWLPSVSTERNDTPPGIFFSIWINSDSLSRNRVCYNIHALKLRSLPGCKIQSREFAAAFRAAVSLRDWPNVSVDHGPQTLMQGWIALSPGRLGADAVALSRLFIPLAPIIDLLLEQRRA